MQVYNFQIYISIFHINILCLLVQKMKIWQKHLHNSFMPLVTISLY